MIELREQEPRGGRRRCIAGRRSDARERLLRFVVAPDGRLVADIEERLPGRGIWLEARRERLGERRTLKSLARLGARLDDPEEMAREIERRLERRCLDLLGLARRARQVALGYEKVRSALARGRVALLIVARDASANAKARFRRLPPGVVRVEAFDRAALARAVGREDVVYVAVAPGRLADKLWRELQRLSGFREIALAGSPPAGQTEGREDTQRDE